MDRRRTRCGIGSKLRLGLFEAPPLNKLAFNGGTHWANGHLSVHNTNHTRKPGRRAVPSSRPSTVSGNVTPASCHDECNAPPVRVGPLTSHGFRTLCVQRKKW